MSLQNLTVSPEAEAELTAACQWYEDQRFGLGDVLRLEFRDALKRIQEDPDSDVINIVAFIHAHRHPKVWKAAIRSRT